tara:strand:+ start:274 stop:498 length:225 start_codon:yes stop_codon:yes gene_type:complete
MTPRDKAIELVEQFMEHTVEWDNVKEVAFDSEFHAKKCALVAVDELIKEQEKYNNGSFYPSKYWQEVKQEIEKL